MNVDVHRSQKAPFTALQGVFTYKDISMSYRRKNPYEDKKASNPLNLSLLFLHNGGTSNVIWTNQMDALGKDFDVIAVDLPGFGDSPMAENEITLKNYTEVLQQFIESLRLNHILLVGNCMGSNIAYKLASTIKDKISGIVFINPLTQKTFKNGKLGWLYLLDRRFPGAFDATKNLSKKLRLPTLVSKGVTAFQVGELKNSKQVLSNRELLACNMRKDQLPALLTVLRDMDSYGSFDSIDDDLADLPTIVILGKKNKVLSFAKMSELSKRISPYKSYVLDHCGHLPMLEDPETVTGIIRDFISYLNTANLKTKGPFNNKAV
jgi:pimeloyl-ACP methyl ester carboxylesterase